MARNIELPTQLERPPNKGTTENNMPSAIQYIHTICKNEILRILIIAAGSALVNCAEPKYITREKGSAPETTRSEARKDAELAVNCSTGEKKCDYGKYLLCVHVEGNCSCRDVEKETCTKSGSVKDGTYERTCSTTTARVCDVSDVSFTPQNIEELVGEPIEWSQKADVLQCSPDWYSSVGFKRGQLWAHIPAEDVKCRITKPIE